MSHTHCDTFQEKSFSKTLRNISKNYPSIANILIFCLHHSSSPTLSLSLSLSLFLSSSRMSHDNHDKHDFLRFRSMTQDDGGLFPVCKEGIAPIAGGNVGQCIGVLTSGGDSQGKYTNYISIEFYWLDYFWMAKFCDQSVIPTLLLTI